MIIIKIALGILLARFISRTFERWKIRRAEREFAKRFYYHQPARVYRVTLPPPPTITDFEPWPLTQARYEAERQRRAAAAFAMYYPVEGSK